jgi:antitoxin component HigA of HigAB toxin-antitoxin module
VAKEIKTKEDYAAALADLDRLVALDPGSDSKAGKELQALALLLQDFETREFPVHRTDPMERDQERN